MPSTPTVPFTTPITYYPIGSTVFQVNANTGIREAIVQSVTLVINPQSAALVPPGTMTYLLAYVNPLFGSTTEVAANIFGDYAHASTAYQPLVQII